MLVGVVPTAAGPSSKATPYVGLSKPLVSVLFSLFDTNRDNSLDQAEFMDIMFARASRGLHEVRLCSDTPILIRNVLPHCRFPQRRDLGLFDKATRFTTCVSTALLK